MLMRANETKNFQPQVVTLPLRYNSNGVSPKVLYTTLADQFSTHYLESLGVNATRQNKQLVQKQIQLHKCNIQPYLISRTNTDIVDSVSIRPPLPITNINNVKSDAKLLTDTYSYSMDISLSHTTRALLQGGGNVEKSIEESKSTLQNLPPTSSITDDSIRSPKNTQYKINTDILDKIEAATATQWEVNKSFLIKNLPTIFNSSSSNSTTNNNHETFIKHMETLSIIKTKFVLPFAAVRTKSPLEPMFEDTMVSVEWTKYPLNMSLQIEVPSTIKFALATIPVLPISTIESILVTMVTSEIPVANFFPSSIEFSKIQRAISIALHLFVSYRLVQACSPLIARFAAIWIHVLYWEVFGQYHGQVEEIDVIEEGDKEKKRKNDVNELKKKHLNIKPEEAETLAICAHSIYADIRNLCGAKSSSLCSLYLPFITIIIKLLIEKIFYFLYPSFASHTICCIALCERINILFSRQFDNEGVTSKIISLESSESISLYRKLKYMYPSFPLLSLSNPRLPPSDDQAKAFIRLASNLIISQIHPNVRVMYEGRISTKAFAGTNRFSRTSPFLIENVLKGGSNCISASTRTMVVRSIGVGNSIVKSVSNLGKKGLDMQEKFAGVSDSTKALSRMNDLVRRRIVREYTEKAMVEGEDYNEKEGFEREGFKSQEWGEIMESKEKWEEDAERLQKGIEMLKCGGVSGLLKEGDVLIRKLSDSGLESNEDRAESGLGLGLGLGRMRQGRFNFDKTKAFRSTRYWRTPLSLEGCEGLDLCAEEALSNLQEGKCKMEGLRKKERKRKEGRREKVNEEGKGEKKKGRQTKGEIEGKEEEREKKEEREAKEEERKRRDRNKEKMPLENDEEIKRVNLGLVEEEIKKSKDGGKRFGQHMEKEVYGERQPKNSKSLIALELERNLKEERMRRRKRQGTESSSCLDSWRKIFSRGREERAAESLSGRRGKQENVLGIDRAISDPQYLRIKSQLSDESKDHDENKDRDENKEKKIEINEEKNENTFKSTKLRLKVRNMLTFLSDEIDDEYMEEDGNGDEYNSNENRGKTRVLIANEDNDSELIRRMSKKSRERAIYKVMMKRLHLNRLI